MFFYPRHRWDVWKAFFFGPLGGRPLPCLKAIFRFNLLNPVNFTHAVMSKETLFSSLFDAFYDDNSLIVL